jgi:hypothetical protein
VPPEIPHAPHLSPTRWLLLALLLLALPIRAEVFLPTGEYRVTVEDLRVKVRNGWVVI